jgi:hypothetical protein
MKVIWMEDVYDRTGNTGVGYREPETLWPDNWLSFGKEKVFIFIPIILIVVYMHGYYQIEEDEIYARY